MPGAASRPICYARESWPRPTSSISPRKSRAWAGPKSASLSAASASSCFTSSNGAISRKSRARIGRRASASSATASPTIWTTIPASSPSCRRRWPPPTATRRWRRSRRRGSRVRPFRRRARGRSSRCWTAGSGRGDSLLSCSVTRDSLPLLPRDLRHLAHDHQRRAEPVRELVEIVRHHDAHVGPHAGALALRGHPLHQPGRIGEGVVAEGERHALRAGVELFDVRPAAEGLDENELHQEAHFRRRRAEAVDDLGPHRVDLALVLERRQAAVEGKPRRQIRNVAFRNRHRRAELDGWRPHILGRRLLARLDALHRLAHHLLIELVADLLDVAGLLFAQKVARAAQIEVVARELEAG